MKKCKIGISFLLLVVLCIILHQFKMLINYFFALTFHELAHLLVAISRGYKLKQFKIDMFGLSIDLDNEIEDKDSFAVNVAGPMCNLFLCLVCLAMYTLIPKSYNVLNEFCISNLVLAIFNLLPVYPLDGGKIFRAFVKSDKAYARLDIIIRLIFSLLFLALFIYSCFVNINYFYLLMFVFFITSKRKQTPTFSLFKFNKSKSFDKINLIKICESDNLYSIIKHIKKHNYTIFYVSEKKEYLDEDTILELALKYPLSTILMDIK